MNAKVSISVSACLALFLSACASTPQSLIVGKWEVASAKAAGIDAGYTEVAKGIDMAAEFDRDGTAKLTMFGRTLQGTYKLIDGNELEWTMGGATTKSKVNVTATELRLTDDSDRTITYRRK